LAIWLFSMKPIWLFCFLKCLTFWWLSSLAFRIIDNSSIFNFLTMWWNNLHVEIKAPQKSVHCLTTPINSLSSLGEFNLNYKRSCSPWLAPNFKHWDSNNQTIWASSHTKAYNIWVESQITITHLSFYRFL
jgi:hypothetical protein